MGGDAERLSFGCDDVRAVFAGRREHRHRKGVGIDDEERACRARLVCKRLHILHVSKEVGLLDYETCGIFGEGQGVMAHDVDAYAGRFGVGAEDAEVGRGDGIENRDAAASRNAARHQNRFCQ